MTYSKKLQDLVDDMSETTFQRFSHLWWDNTVANKQNATRSILEAKLRRDDVDYSSAIVIAHGPSLMRQRSLETIKQSGYSGVIIAVESAAGVCLRNGIVPHCVVSVDPRPRIVHYFGGDEEKDRLDPADELYYKNRGNESSLGPNPLSSSQVNKELFDKNGSQMIALLSTSVSPRIASRCQEMDLTTYWFNPMYDDEDAPGSFTRKVSDLIPVPCVNAGGNVGTTAWVMAHSLFQIEQVALVGFDFSYYGDSLREQSQYYDILENLFEPEDLDDLLPEFVHPRTGEKFFTDPVYLWFRDVFLEMAATAPSNTFNCTEGGIVIGEPLIDIPLSTFLEQSKK